MAQMIFAEPGAPIAVSGWSILLMGLCPMLTLVAAGAFGAVYTKSADNDVALSLGARTQLLASMFMEMLASMYLMQPLLMAIFALAGAALLVTGLIAVERETAWISAFLSNHGRRKQ